MTTTKPVRVRFAPSPTGKLHIGGARTAIYNWAFARATGGTFVLRIEDTDPERSTEENTQIILRALRWMGLDWDEGPEVGGPCGPYFQTQRTDTYEAALQKLIDAGAAYPCFCTKEELDAKREAAEKTEGGYAGYDRTCRAIPADEAAARVAAGEPHVWRLKVPDDHGPVTFKDAVYGDMSFPIDVMDDMILRRTDGTFTYNFAVVCDDVNMGITHVIRGDDHLSNTPRQVLIYEALGAEVPLFAHLSMILGPDGKKLSKRHGTVSVLEYERQGYLPEAVFNYLARLGWGHGNMEKFTREELAEVFELSDCSRAAARIDWKKFDWLNQQYMKEADANRLADLTKARIEARGGKVEGGPDLAAVCELLKSRSATLEKLADAALFFYVEPKVNEEEAAKVLADGGREALKLFGEKLEAISDVTPEAVYGCIQAVMEEQGIAMKVLANPLRVCVCAADRTPQIDKTLCLIGKEEVLARIARAL